VGDVFGRLHPTATRPLAAAAGAVLVVGACSTGGSGSHATRTVTFTPTAPRVSATAAPTTPSPTPRPQTRLPGPCDELLPLSAVEQAMSIAVSGRTAFVVGVPDKTIHRLAYLNCRYGVPTVPRGAAAVPSIEIGVSLYATAAQAQRRLTATIDDYVSHGATRSATAVAGHPAVLLVGAAERGYDVPLLVLAFGQRTVAVSLSERMAAATRNRAMAAVAALALDRTAG
jgi:hypothetical protein